jgi:hypothetical protein
MSDTKIPVRFNHIGFTVPREALSDANRPDLVDFYGSVFGFVERSEYTKEGELLVLMAGAIDQFLVFFGHDSPVAANPPLDHFGMAVGSEEELLTLLDRVNAYKESRPGTVEATDHQITDQDDVVPHKLHKFYVKFGTPFTLEVQYYEMLHS